MKSLVTLQVYDHDLTVAPRKIYLKLPGEVFDLKLYPSAFYHVNGTSPFYMYARLTSSGKCSICLLFILISSYHGLEVLVVTRNLILLRLYRESVYSKV